MNSGAFWIAVRSLRASINNLSESSRGWANSELDTVIKSTGETNVEKQELDLQEDVARIIKRIKDAKENDALKAKADEVIKSLKESL